MKRKGFKKLSDYSTPQNAHSEQTPTKRGYTSFIIAILGIILLAFSNAHLTGFVVANKTIDSSYPIAAGFILLIVSLLLSLIKNKKR